jgi:hypothetical protein
LTLVGAEKGIDLACERLDKSSIICDSSVNGLEWYFSSVDSPHRQGLVESLIKSVERALKVTYTHELRMSMSEYSTVGYQVADSVNSRPLGVIGDAGEDLTILTPNCLILGRNKSCNHGHWSVVEGPGIPRMTMIAHLVQRFWERWMQVCRPALVLEKRLSTKVRDLCLADVVLLCESGALKRTYTLCVVHQVSSGKDGKVRTVQVMHKRFKTKEGKESPRYTGSSEVILHRSVQKLVLIVPVDEVRY